MKRFPESEYRVPLFKEVGYVRKLCSGCKEYFWTQKADQEFCGESTHHGCAKLTFIHDPPTRRSYSLSEMREAFLSYFESQSHERIEPYPIVARWRDDLYLTNASIVDFQPYVTNGLIRPPANPLVISQPCIRLVDVNDVGPTFGRHFTIFEMGGHHAFNYPDEEVYWKDETVRYHHEFLTKELGVKSEEIVYKEDVWVGGGNAGPDLETVIRGLEVDTLVFMKYKVEDGKFVEIPIRTVDTGYGIDRYAWISQGAVSGFHAVYGSIVPEICRMADVRFESDNVLIPIAEASGVIGRNENKRVTALKGIAKKNGLQFKELNKSLSLLESVFTLVDHSKCLLFLLSEGVVPSNVEEGYLARLMFRRTYRILRKLGVEEQLFNIMELQVKCWSEDFPLLKDVKNEVFEMMSVERRKFEDTLAKGSLIVKRIAGELKINGKEEMPTSTLIKLYDSNGLPPEIVKETAEREGVHVKIPGDFYKKIAEQHAQAPEKHEELADAEFTAKFTGFEETRKLYYENPSLSKFEAKVLAAMEGKFVVLDCTAFYPEGGGQPADLGVLWFKGGESQVVDVKKAGEVVVHIVEGELPRKNDVVVGTVNWERRGSLMRHHTATHVLIGAARRILGQHVRQAGAQKGVEQSRVDISHFRRLTLKETQKIEKLANQALTRNIPVTAEWMLRTEAERIFGFKLYQGGVVPGKEIRVLKIGDWDVAACGGTHVTNLGEIGIIKIIRTERIQDGVERLVFSAGPAALKPMQENDKLISKLGEILNAPRDKLLKTAERLVREWKETRRRERQLIKEIAALEGEAPRGEAGKKVVDVAGKKLVIQTFGGINIERMISTANEVVKRNPGATAFFYGNDSEKVRFIVRVGREALESGVNADEIAREASLALQGGGGGERDFAQGGGVRTEELPKALQKAEEAFTKQLE